MGNNSKKGVNELLQEATTLTIEYYDFVQSKATDREKLTLADIVIKTLSELCSIQHKYLTEVNDINNEAYMLSLKPTPKQ